MGGGWECGGTQAGPSRCPGNPVLSAQHVRVLFLAHPKVQHFQCVQIRGIDPNRNPSQNSEMYMSALYVMLEKCTQLANCWGRRGAGGVHCDREV